MKERRRGQAYSQDLRDRVFALVDEGREAAEAAELLKVDRSYIYKALIRRRLTGETSARPQRCRLEPKLAPYHEAIRAQVAAVPDATIEELRTWLLATHGVASSVGGMWKTLDRLGLTFKKRPVGRASRNARTSPPPGRLGVSANPS
jgi:transposase